MKRRSVSVGRRLASLVVAEVATAVLLLILGLVSVGKVVSDSDFMHRFVLVPIQQLTHAIDAAAVLGTRGDAAQAARSLSDIARFASHYRANIQVSGSTSADAGRQTAQLRRAGALELISREQRIVADIEELVEHLSHAAGDQVAADAPRLRELLWELMEINLTFIKVAQEDIWIGARRTCALLVSAGLGAVVLAAFLGLHVRWAIAPRIASLVLMVKRFQEVGVHERVLEQGQDDIAVLANALDTGFAAIAERDRSRERFLAIAAHEFKTPLASIKGFAQVAVAHPEQRERALDVIRRQADRLNRLIEDLLAVACARLGGLPFHPTPIDLAELTRRVATEVEASTTGHAVCIDAPIPIRLLADEGLMSHALWALMTCAFTLSAQERPIHVHLYGEPTEARVRVTAEVQGSPLSPEDQARMFEPFSFTPYEGKAYVRSAVNLCLCRDIVRLHGGNVGVSERPGVGPVLTLELPA